MQSKNKNILILGASLLQKPAIQSAKELGCKVFVVDGNPKALCVPLADVFEQIDLKDEEKLLSYAKQIQKTEGLSGVFTAGTDFSKSVAYITENLGLPGHSYQSACNASDKALMRSCFKKHKVNSPNFVVLTENDLPKIQNDCKNFLLSNGFLLNESLVIKPCDNMGARGCKKIENLDDNENFVEAVKDSIKNSRSGRAILEEFMDGKEFSIDALVYKNELLITGFADRHIFYPPYFIEMGHTMPTDLLYPDFLDVVTEFAKGVKALGLSCGAAKGDVKLTSKGVMIGEIAGRLSGGYMSGWTFPYSSDINLTKQGILLALGEKLDISPSQVEVLQKPSFFKKTYLIKNCKIPKVCAERAWISIPGKVKKIFGIPEIDDKNSVLKDVFIRGNVGDDVKFPVNNVEKCGNIITLAENRDEAIQEGENIIKNIVLRLEPNNPITCEFLEQDLQTEFPLSAFNIDFDFENIEKMNSEIEVSSLRDWNYRTIKDTVELFEKITSCKISEVQNPKKFWKYLLRGGIQGALYFYDSNLDGVISNNEE